jgi:hypothetical protein
VPGFAWSNFAAGELGPTTLGRIDAQGYYQGCKRLINFIVDKRGGLFKRPGTFLFDEIAGTGPINLVPFTFNYVDTYILVFYGKVGSRIGVLRWRDDGSAPEWVPSYQSYNSPMINPFPYPQDIKYAQYVDTMYLVAENAPIQKITAKQGDSGPTFEIKELNILRIIGGTKAVGTASTADYRVDMGGGSGGGGWGFFAPAGHRAKGGTYEYDKDTWLSPTDVGFVAGDYVLARGTPNERTITFTALENDEGWGQGVGYLYILEPNYLPSPEYEVRGEATFKRNDKEYSLTVLGSISSQDTYGDVWTVLITNDPGEGKRPPQEGASSWTFERTVLDPSKQELKYLAYPRCVAIHDQRLWFAGTNERPQFLWGSRIRDFEDFEQPILEEGEELTDEDPVEFAIASQVTNPIHWLISSGGKLLAGTLQTTYIIDGDANKGITPSSVRVVSDTSVGSTSLQPVRIGNLVVCTYRSGTRLQAIGYRFEGDAYNSVDLNLMNPDILKPGVVSLAWQEEPNPMIYCILKDGNWATCTIDLEARSGIDGKAMLMAAWARHYTAGGKAKATTCIPFAGFENSYDVVWLAIQRKDATCLEWISYSHGCWGPAVTDRTSIVDDPTLDTEVINIVNGFPINYSPIVSELWGGSNKIKPPHISDWYVYVPEVRQQNEKGIGIYAMAELLPPENPQSPVFHLQKRMASILVKLWRTWGLVVNGQESFTHMVAEVGQTSPQVLDGFIKVTNFGWSKAGTIVLEHDDPWPCHILLLGGEVSVGGS